MRQTNATNGEPKREKWQAIMSEEHKGNILSHSFREFRLCAHPADAFEMNVWA